MISSSEYDLGGGEEVSENHLARRFEEQRVLVLHLRRHPRNLAAPLARRLVVVELKWLEGE